MVAAFIDDHRERFGVEPICRVLSEHGIKIAPSTYYAHKTRPRSARSVRDADLKKIITEVHADRTKGRGVAGYRKMWHLLRRDGHQVARCTVARLMRELGLRGVIRGHRVRTTVADQGANRPADHVRREFTADAPNTLWVVDFTYVPTWSGMCFTAFVTDVYSRHIVGWRTHHRMPIELPLDALEMALWIRERAGQPVNEGLVHHSDAGSQYTAIRYADRLAEVGAIASIGTVGDSYDNAMAESIIGLYKTECVQLDGPFRTVDELELATLDWVHYYNEYRLHSAIGYLTPIEYEQYHRQINPRPQPQPGEPALH